MNRRTFLIVSGTVVGLASMSSGGEDLPARKKLPDGVYAVERLGDREKDLHPLKEGEVLAVNRHRYLKAEAKDPPSYLVVHANPDVSLHLAGEPQADKDGEEVVSIRLKLKPKAAAALEELTRARRGKQLAIVVDGEVVTVHKIREVIANGDVQITSCSPGGANYLMKQLQGREKSK
jgi:preprotein translocase subunit SecD